MAATKRKINFKNVKDQGQFNPRHVESGDYVMKVVKVDDHKTNEGKEMWLFTCSRKGDARATYPYYVSTEEKQAWKIRKLFIACGIQVPKKLVLVDPNKVVGKEFGAFLEDDEYEGRMKSVIQDTFPKEDVAEDDDRPAKKKGKSKPVEDDDEDEDEVDLDEDEDTEDDSDDDDADEDDDDSDDEDDDEEEEPESVVVKKKAKKKAAAPAPVKKAATKKKKAKVVEDDDDEDLDLEEI